MSEHIRPDTEYYTISINLDGGYMFHATYFTVERESLEHQHDFATGEEMFTFSNELQAKLVADGWQKTNESWYRGVGGIYFQRKR